MFKNYFTIAFRSFWRNKVFTFINIAGLAIGISASLVIYLIVQYEFSFENFQKDKDRIYRVVTNMHFPDMDFKNGGIPGPLPAAMRREIPGIESSTAFYLADDVKVSLPATNGAPKVFRRQKEIVYADSLYFNFMNYSWIAGSPATALQNPNEVVLTESRARQYFDYADLSQAVGQIITYYDTVPAKVTGIVKDLDEVTVFSFREFISLPTFKSTLKEYGYEEWGSVNSSSQFFLKLQKGVSAKKVNAELAAVRKKNEKDAYLKTDHYLQALTDIHFNPDYDALNQPKGNKTTLYGLLGVALFLLMLGCINFINLTTAQASQRAKEIGIRKTMGSSRSKLVVQFLSETFLLALLATILSIVLLPWLLNIFKKFIPEGLDFEWARQSNILLFVFLLIPVVSFVAGFYPALVLSRYKPVTVLKNVAHAGTGQTRRAWLRKTLTISQFVIAQFFIIGTLVVSKQIRFSLNKDMGFRKDAIITFRVPHDFLHPEVNAKQFTMLAKVRSIPGIDKISLAGAPPASNGTSSTTMKFTKDDGQQVETTVEIKQADSAYFDLYKMKFLAGRQLQQSDTTREYVINESYLKFLGYKNPRDIIGKYIDDRNVPIVGVLADFNTKSTHAGIKPLAYVCQAKNHFQFHILLSQRSGNTDSWKATIARIEKAYKELYPEEEFSYSFFDDTIAQFYKKEQETAGLLRWSTGLAIFISCLGLLGLVTFTTNQRVKEIGVRKVLGASVMQIVSLLSKDYIKLVLLAFVIAAPLAWWAANEWLNDFVYRTTISWWVFAACGFFMLLVALILMSFKTIRSAMANPVKSLRTE